RQLRHAKCEYSKLTKNTVKKIYFQIICKQLLRECSWTMPTLTPYYMGIVLKFLYIYKKNIIKLQILNQLHYSLLLTFTEGLVQRL
ncbi:MAG: hypothetical protein K8R54_16285, partial [Bacteroidales bacterium]|nr:hypothetical protein [Bacteroidales bacterium]